MKKNSQISNLFEQIFNEIVQNLVNNVFINCETIFTDSTHIQANAASKSLRPSEEYIKNWNPKK